MLCPAGPRLGVSWVLGHVRLEWARGCVPSPQGSRGRSRTQPLATTGPVLTRAANHRGALQQRSRSISSWAVTHRYSLKRRLRVVVGGMARCRLWARAAVPRRLAGVASCTLAVGHGRPRAGPISRFALFYGRSFEVAPVISCSQMRIPRDKAGYGREHWAKSTWHRALIDRGIGRYEHTS